MKTIMIFPSFHPVRCVSFTFIMISLCLITMQSKVAWADNRVKVGIFQNKPIVYDEDGPQGLFVDVLKQVAAEEAWDLDFVTCEFKECLNLLKANKLDLMTSLGKSEERQKHFNYSKEAIWTFWGTIYTRERGVNSILDLEGKKIGVRRKNKITLGLKTLVSQFQIPLVYSEFDNYETAFDALKNNLVDVVAVNNTYAFTRKDINEVFYKTPIVFDPFSAYFAVPKKKGNRALLDRIDHHVKNYKASQDSVFQQFHDQWFGLTATYWTTQRILVLSGVLVFITAALMAFWRYRSLVTINEALVQNVAEREQAQEDLARTNMDLNAKNEELEQVVYVASHDLRSPLVNIDGYSKELEFAVKELNQVLTDPAVSQLSNQLKPILDEDIPEALKFIRASALKMERLLSGLLRLSRSGRAAIHIEPLDMNHLVAKVMESLEFKINESNVKVSVQDLPECMSDAIQIDQVFTNLLDNAIKCLDPERPGAIRVSGEIAGNRSVYCIEDNGIGIDGNHINKIFEIFHQLEPDKDHGEGLGLTIVNRLLSRLDGSIRVESEPGVGSRFYISLPKGES
ncbi:MAG: hypothetical protein D3926_08370 [Desulfobacteraceae bacterium]|nr:MAG: hypothetical protein D3926_08370 [Desulfobacteraceae bacterium]